MAGLPPFPLCAILHVGQELAGDEQLMRVLGALKMSMSELTSLARKKSKMTWPVSREHAQGLLSISAKRREKQRKSKTQADLCMSYKHVVLPESYHFTHYISISFLWRR